MVEYSDIILLGRSGIGRSTLAKKLIDLKNQDPLNLHEVETTGEQDPKCKLQTNEEIKVRVLDVPGFSEGSQEKLQLQENLQIVECIGKAQKQFQLQVSRIVYFLPKRGPLEKADGSVQEELKMLNHYFGKEIFDCVVVAATYPKRYQHVGFDENDFKVTKEAFHIALKSAVDDDIECPPVIYVSLDESPKETLHKIQSAPVVKNQVIKLAFKDDAGPLYPQGQVEVIEDSQAIEDPAANRLAKKNPGSTTAEPHTAKNGQQRYQHSRLIPKYKAKEKVLGGFAHVATLGIFYCIKREPWPCFFNSDRVCERCHKSPDDEDCIEQMDDETTKLLP